MRSRHDGSAFWYPSVYDAITASAKFGERRELAPSPTYRSLRSSTSGQRADMRGLCARHGRSLG
jgi:hypothetical protein